MLTLEQVQAAGGYSVIYADPCWSYQDKGRAEPFPRYRGVENHYRTLSVQELCLLPVDQLAGENCALFMWVCWPLLADALAVMKAWGFTYKTCAFDWIKTYASGDPVVGLGRYTRGSSEPCLLGVKGKNMRVDKGVRQALETLEQEAVKYPLGEHSAKPPEVRERIVRLLGDVPRIELFSRDRTEGWDQWGDQVPGGSDVTL